MSHTYLYMVSGEDFAISPLASIETLEQNRIPVPGDIKSSVDLTEYAGIHGIAVFMNR